MHFISCSWQTVLNRKHLRKHACKNAWPNVVFPLDPINCLKSFPLSKVQFHLNLWKLNYNKFLIIEDKIWFFMNSFIRNLSQLSFMRETEIPNLFHFIFNNALKVMHNNSSRNSFPNFWKSFLCNLILMYVCMFSIGYSIVVE